MPSRRPGMASDALARAAFALAESSHEVVPGGQPPVVPPVSDPSPQFPPLPGAFHPQPPAPAPPASPPFASARVESASSQSHSGATTPGRPPRLGAFPWESLPPDVLEAPPPDSPQHRWSLWDDSPPAERALCVEQRVSNVGTCLALVADVLDQLGAYQIPMQCDAFDDVGPRAVGGSGFNDADLAHVA
ncbi:unnamed protein product [Closterium sp. NIES-64]|nr:unnamed protein product [Closterium sp. NIES-64]